MDCNLCVLGLVKCLLSQTGKAPPVCAGVHAGAWLQQGLKGPGSQPHGDHEQTPRFVAPDLSCYVHHGDERAPQG